MFVLQSTRGKHTTANKKSEEANALVEEHINSFHPSISHYRRKHAPFRRYISPELNITILYDDFNTKHPRLVSKEFYRKKIKKMNISFCRLGEEECEICLTYHAHIKDCDKKQVSDVLKEIMNTIEETELGGNVDFQVHSKV